MHVCAGDELKLRQCAAVVSEQRLTRRALRREATREAMWEAVRKVASKVVEKCLEALRKLLGASSDEKSDWKVLSATATAWRDDQRALGSYSFLAPGCIPEDVDALAAPCWGGVLRWAGEHTSREHLATAAGALESGRAEARRIARETGLLSLSDDEEEESWPHVAKPKRPSREAMRDARSALCVRSFVRRDTSEDVCALCGLKSGEDADVEGFMAGPLLAFEQGSRVVWVHDGCAAASSEVRHTHPKRPLPRTAAVTAPPRRHR